MKKELKIIIAIVAVLVIIIEIVAYIYNNKINLVIGVITAIFCAILIPNLYIKKEISIPKLFLKLVPVIMLLFLVTMPSFKNADEPMHWRRIYDIMQGNFITKTKDGVAIGKLPESVAIYHNYSDEFEIKYEDFKELYDKKISSDEEKVTVSLETTAVYHFIQYMPQVIGAKIVDIFTDRPFLIMYGARIGNIVFSLIILYLAIRIIPYGKKILLLLSCIPIAAASFASMSPDAMTISMSYLFISYILKLLDEKDKKINWKQKLLLLVMAVIVALCKIVYLPLVGLALLLPKDKYKSRKEQVITCIIIMGVAICVNLLWLNFASGYLTTYKRRKPRNKIT